MKNSTWIALGITAAAAAWLASGLVIPHQDREETASVEEGPQPTLVEVRHSSAEPVSQYIFAQGVAQPYRTADVVSPTGGTLDEIEVGQGDEVETGAVLARVRLEARESQLASAEAQVRRLEADLAALRELRSEGFATEAQLRELEAQLQDARAALENVRADIRDTTIEAPIAGVVSDVFINSGETAPAGTSVLRIVDNTPLRVTIHVSQRDVGRVDVGREAAISFATGTLAKGRVCFVAPAADPQTRTFRVEIRVPNEERKIPSVISSEVRFKTGDVEGHFISAAVLALGETGELGVKTVNEDNVVEFHPVEIIRASADGMWVAGLPSQARLIITGQGFVRDGESVRVSEAESEPSGSRGAAPLPTTIVEGDEAAFAGVGDLPPPPSEEDLCRGAAANSVLTGSAPAGSAAASGSASNAGIEMQPGGGTSASKATPQSGSGARAGTVSPGGAGARGSRDGPAGPSVDPISPEVSTPPIGQTAPQAPGGAGLQPGGGGPATGSAPPASGTGGGQGSTP